MAAGLPLQESEMLETYGIGQAAARPEVCSVLAGSLDIAHIRENLRLALAARPKKILASPPALG